MEHCEYIRKSLFLGEVKHRFWKDPSKSHTKKVMQYLLAGCGTKQMIYNFVWSGGAPQTLVIFTSVQSGTRPWVRKKCYVNKINNLCGICLLYCVEYLNFLLGCCLCRGHNREALDQDQGIRTTQTDNI